MKKLTIEIKWSFIYIIIALFWILFEKLLGLHDQYIDKHPIYSSLFVIPSIIVYIFALKDKKKNFYNGNMNWKQGFLTGITISLIIAVLSPLSQYISNNYISPDFLENASQYAVKMKMMTVEGAKNYFNLRSYIIQSAFGALSFGVVNAAIVAYFLQNKK